MPLGRERQKGEDDRKMGELVAPLLPFLPLDSSERIDVLPLGERANGHAVSSLPSRSFVEAPCLPDGLVMPGPERYIAEVAETEAEIERKYKDQVVVFTEADVPDEANRRYPNFPQWEEGDVGAGGEVERQGLVTRQAALRELVALVQEIQERIKNEGEEDHVWQKGVKHGMYKAMYDTENNWEQRGALFWAKYRPDPDLDFLWAHRVELSGAAGVPMWLLLPEDLCTQRMWEAKQGFLEFVQAKWKYYQEEPVEEGNAFEGEKETWANRTLPVQNPLKRHHLQEPDLNEWDF